MTKAIEIIYSAQSTDFIKGQAYANPVYYIGPRSNVAKVQIVGDYPQIKADYEALGIPVEIVSSDKAQAGPAPVAGPSAELTARIADMDKLDAPIASAGGLTRREMHADLSAAGQDIDPTASVAKLVKTRKARKAKA